MTGAPTGTPAATAGHEPDPKRWRALSVTLVAGFMSLLDVSIVSVALPSIQRGLGTDPAGVQWVVSGYALTFGLALIPAGRLGDALGRRRMFLLALGGFVLFSALAGAAPTTGLLIAARLAQGLAAGALAPQNSGLIQQLFRGAERGRAFGLFGATVGISTAVGPVTGGVILALAGEPDGWRWIFFVNVPIGVMALVLAARLIPHGGGAGRRGHIDFVGVALLGGGVLAAMLPLVQAESGGITRLWWLFPLAAVLIVSFVYWERRVIARHREPLLDIRLLTDTTGYASGAGLGFAYLGLVATAVVLALAPPEAAGWAVAAPLLVAGIGGGWVIAPNTTMTLRCVPVAMAGSAGGALQTGQRIGSAVGTAALAGTFYAVLSATGKDYPVAVSVAMGGAALAVSVALLIGIGEWRRALRRTADAAVEERHHIPDPH